MKILCKLGIHKWKIWYEGNNTKEYYCSRCGDKRSVVEIYRDEPYNKPSLKDKRKKKLAKIKLDNVLNRKKL